MSLSSDAEADTGTHNDDIHFVIHESKRSDSFASLEDPGNVV